jgi:dipeptidyl aminopeptidase/acylaminoacyl peptidase
MAGLTRPADLFVVPLEGGEPRQLTESMPAGNLESRLIVPEKIRYPSTDGFTISAYLYRPPSAAPGDRFPGILWIHGGPTGQYRDMYEPFGEGGSGDAQFFAQRGYVVLAPNIRGSSGYGKAFEDGNNGCWGACDLEDVVAGVDYLKTLPEVDLDRMGITGTSYGGIMSMIAAAYAPDVFRAAIPASGYADWLHFYRGENELRHVKLLEYELGPLATNEAAWRRASAIYAVADVSTPLFLVHGVGRYPGSDQSELFAQALRNNYKPFRYETYENETYYVLGRENRRRLMHDMLDFFDQFLKDRVVLHGGRRGSDRE